MPNMAVATSALSSRRDSALQHSASLFSSAVSGQYNGYCNRNSNLSVFPPYLPPRPALLPFGTIQPNASQDENELKMPAFLEGSGLRIPPVSTPTMHPNLVMTLKSLISPPADNSLDQARNGAAGAMNRVNDALSNGSEGCNPRNNMDLTGLFVISPSAPKVEMGTPEADDDEAAVVPVDLIQNRRPFKCGHAGCNKTFKNPQTMKMHHKTHYSDDSSLRHGGSNAHILSTLPSAYKAGHNKKIPSRCPICKKTFVGLYELRRHYGRKHSEGEKTFACKKCGKKFYIEVDLRDHEKLCGEPIECKCGMKFAFKCNLVAHKKGHPECQDHPPPTEEEQKQNQNSAAVAPSPLKENPRPVKVGMMKSEYGTLSGYQLGTEGNASSQGCLVEGFPVGKPISDFDDLPVNDNSIYSQPLTARENFASFVKYVQQSKSASTIVNPPSSQSSSGECVFSPSKPFFHQSNGASTMVNPMSSRSSGGGFVPKFIS